ncbi:MAG TPA: hypothetical protein VGS07_32530 [Thermoanaerobaculia bacterium]|nr:hypothetical protein [Thermoanaerobaculia bacterium]
MVKSLDPSCSDMTSDHEDPVSVARTPLTSTRSRWASAAVPRRVMLAPGTIVPGAGSVMTRVGGVESRSIARVAWTELPAWSSARAVKVLLPSASGTCRASQVVPVTVAMVPLTVTAPRCGSWADPTTSTEPSFSRAPVAGWEIETVGACESRVTWSVRCAVLPAASAATIAKVRAPSARVYGPAVKSWPARVTVCPSTLTEAAPDTWPVRVTWAAERMAASTGCSERKAGGVVSTPKPTARVAELPAASVTVTDSRWVPSPETGVPEVKAEPSSVASTVTAEASVV